MPRKMLPPPTTMAIWTPALCAVRISSADEGLAGELEQYALEVWFGHAAPSVQLVARVSPVAARALS
jgi:hypothetical protein